MIRLPIVAAERKWMLAQVACGIMTVQQAGVANTGY